MPHKLKIITPKMEKKNSYVTQTTKLTDTETISTYLFKMCICSYKLTIKIMTGSDDLTGKS